MRIRLLLSCALLALAGAAGPVAAESPQPVRVIGHTDMPGYKGDFDHFAIDAPDNRLFLAGEDGGALKVFNLKTGALERSVPGFQAPHSLIYLPQTHELVVIADHDSRVLDARTLKVRRKLNLGAGADSIAYDAPRRRVYVVTGGKDVKMATTALVEFDPYTGRTYGETPLDGDHTEALAVEQHGDRIFINQTDKNLLDVIDKKTHAILARWKIKEAQQNATVAYDEKTHRLFVGTRAPGKLLVIDADTGRTIQSFDGPAKVDQVLWDAGERRVFVCGGDGHLQVIEQQDADHYRALPLIATPAAAKTGIYDPALHRLFLASSPGDSGSMAQLLWLSVEPRR